MLRSLSNKNEKFMKDFLISNSAPESRQSGARIEVHAHLELPFSFHVLVIFGLIKVKSSHRIRE